MIDSGLFTVSRSPWTNPKMASILRNIGRAPKKQLVIRKTPPWAKARAHLRGGSQDQIRVWMRLTESAIANRGKPLGEFLANMQRSLTTGRKPKMRTYRGEATLALLRSLAQTAIARPQATVAPLP
ncbi:MAG: hypothetical protein QXE38_05200 [Candidatus Methanomethylicia archaeon]